MINLFSKYKKGTSTSSSADSAISWNSYVEIVEDIDIDRLSEKNNLLLINTLDKQIIPVVADENCFVSEVYKKCCTFLGIRDLAYMGLSVRGTISSDDVCSNKKQYEYYFIDNEMKLSKALKTFSHMLDLPKYGSNSEGYITLYLRIKYFTQNISLIRCPVVVLNYYLQLRNNFLQNQHLYSLCNEELYWYFIYHIIQADGHGNDSNKLPYHKYFPSWILKFRGILFIKNSLDQLNSQYPVKDRGITMKKFCEEVINNTTFSINAHLYFLQMKVGNNEIKKITFAISDEGLVIWITNYKQMTVECKKIKWKKINKINLCKNKITIKCDDGFCSDILCQDNKIAKEIFLFCKKFHQQTLHFNLQAYNNAYIFGDHFSIFSDSELGDHFEI
uniref:Protein expanded (inferred by orthology to a D. melanogaster protein) n=1 Tax=Strongyloides venezuelensis TaxID=75913 RepID=A0A0K0FMJ2_STRVS